MSASTSDSMPRGRSWRSIRQEVAAPALSRKGRKRRHLGWLKAAGVIVFVAAGAWGGHELARSWADRPALASAANKSRLAAPVLITDGVITTDWLGRQLALPPSATLMSLDLVELRERVLAHGQVKVAVLARDFPDTLVVTLQERTPVARVRVQDGGGLRQLLVARDGTVYEGVNYSRELLGSLPWLDGLALRRQGDGYAPVAGMEAVAALLATGQTEATWLYRDWQVVSLARLAAHDEIVVRMAGGPEVVFTRRQDFYKQVARLDFILEEARQRVGAAPVRVNLALGQHAAVAFDRPARELAAAEAPSTSFRLQPSEKRASRDLFQ